MSTITAPAPVQTVYANEKGQPTAVDIVTSVDSVKDWMRQVGKVSVIDVVRENKNHKQYVTFMSADNTADNVYFSAAAREEVATGQSIAKGFFDEFIMVQVQYTYADGSVDTIWKISVQGASNRVTLDNL